MEERRKSKATMQSWEEDKKFRQRLLDRVRNGDPAMPRDKPGMRYGRN
jgi:hypothetical protein